MPRLLRALEHRSRGLLTPLHAMVEDAQAVLLIPGDLGVMWGVQGGAELIEIEVSHAQAGRFIWVPRRFTRPGPLYLPEPVKGGTTDPLPDLPTLTREQVRRLLTGGR